MAASMMRPSRSSSGQLRNAKSFTRLESPTSNPLTFPENLNGDVEDRVVDGMSKSAATDSAGGMSADAVQERRDAGMGDESSHASADCVGSLGPLEESVDELPIELASMSDRFIDSLSAKVHPTPPSGDRLSALFQDFYVSAASCISTHISSIASRRQRDLSPAPLKSSRSSSLTGKGRPRTWSMSSKDSGQGVPDGVPPSQLLTTAEIIDRRRARMILEKQRVELEEAVERRVCETVYDRIWRHRSTEDEVRDEKLRSRTAALAVIGVGPTELGIELKSAPDDQHTVDEAQIRDWLGTAREELLKMDEGRYPVAKLLHLKAAHKCVVDALSRIHPTSSSADEILPAMIYTLITTRHEGVNIISNLAFIQRFRDSSKIDGEAAYCLTTLEAAITFLETVDIASLRADETSPSNAKSSPASSSSPSQLPQTGQDLTTPTQTESPMSMNQEMKATSESESIQTIANAQPEQVSSTSPQQPANLPGVPSAGIPNRADQSFKTIGNALESSYNLLFGRLRERELNSTDVPVESPRVLPKTLDEARRLVGTPPPADSDASGSLTISHSDGVGGKANDKFLSLPGGSRMTQERSSDSTRSGGSGRKVSSFDSTSTSKENQTLPTSSGQAAATGQMAVPSSGSSLGPAVESMRHIGSTFNPLNRLAGMNAMLSFGRGAQSPPTVMQSTAGVSGQTATTDSDSTSSVSTATKARNIAPPIRKFMEVDNPGELKINEVLELLRDYRRLAGALEDLKKS